MNAFRWFEKTMQFLSEGAARIFSPAEDDYPPTGPQPFEGDIQRRRPAGRDKLP